MKKLISILTLASFSLVPTSNIIACENGDNSDDEIVGETIAQEIVDGAIDEINQEPKNYPFYVKKTFENKKLWEAVPNYRNYPECIPMIEILTLFNNFMGKNIFNNKYNVFKLNLSLNTTDSHFKWLEQNVNKFKVIPTNKNKNWFDDVKKVNSSDNPKTYEFKLKFGKTLSKKQYQLICFEIMNKRSGKVMKRLSFDFIINKIWRQGISKWYKSKKFWICMAPISILTTASIVVTTYFVVDNNKEKPILTLTQVETPEDIIYKVPKPTFVSPETIYYNIDGKNFSTYKKAFEYFKTQLQKEENSYNLLRYAFEGQEYATQTKLYDVLKNRFSINKINTLRNPYMNIINNANEVSRNAITIPTENFRTVYRGKDGSSYTNYEDALDTYMDFDQKYSVENITFDSKTEALWHLQHTKQELLDAQIKELEGKDSAQKNSISDKHKLDCYLRWTESMIRKKHKSRIWV